MPKGSASTMPWPALKDGWNNATCISGQFQGHFLTVGRYWGRFTIKYKIKWILIIILKNAAKIHHELSMHVKHDSLKVIFFVFFIFSIKYEFLFLWTDMFLFTITRARKKLKTSKGDLKKKLLEYNYEQYLS